MSLFEIVSIIVTIAISAIGAGWVLLSLASKFKKEADDQKIKSTNESIYRLEKLFDKLDARVDAIENKWGVQFANLTESVNNLKVILASVTKGTETAVKSIDVAYGNFYGVVEKLMGRSNVKDLGEGYIRVTSPKKIDGE